MLEFLLWVLSKFQVAIAIYTLTGGVISALFMGIRFRQQTAFISSRLQQEPLRQQLATILQRGNDGDFCREL